MEEALTGANLADGVENIFRNDTNNYAKNIERIDYIHQDGFIVTKSEYEDVGFAFLERGANNIFHIAAITEVDAAGNATAFGDLVKFGDGTWGNELNSQDGTNYGLPNSGYKFNTVIVNGNPDPNDPSSFDYDESISTSTQGIGGIFVTLGDLGLSAADVNKNTFYGYALFGGDAGDQALPNGVIPVDVNDSWYNKNTGNDDGGGDLYGGAMLFNPSTITVDLNDFTPIGQNYYWDLNDNVDGSGVLGANPGPNLWNTDPLTDSWGGITGELSTRGWAAEKTAYFSAGADANGDYTVEVDNNPIARGMVFEEGHARVVDENATAGEITLVGFQNNSVDVKPFIKVNAGIEGTVDVDLSSQTGSIDGLAKTGNGTLYLGGDNSFTGDFNIEAGEVYVRNGNAITDTAQVTLFDNTALRLQSDETIGSLRDKVANSETGEVHLNGNELRAGIDGSNTTFSGLINGGVTSQFTKEGTGTMTITGNNTFSGLTKVDAGILLLDSTGQTAISNRIEIGSELSNTQQGTDILRIAQDNQIGDTAHITINGSGRLDLNGYNEEIGDLASAYTTAQVTLGTAGNDNSTLTVQQDGDTTYKGTITGNGTNDQLVLYGGGSLQVEGQVNADVISLRGDTNNATASASPTTLTIGASNIIDNNTDIAFEGGRLRLDDVNETVGNIEINADSFLDFTATGDGSTSGLFTFAQLTNGPSGTLSVENWIGNVAGFTDNTWDGDGGEGNTQLIVKSDNNLGNVAELGEDVAGRFNFLGYGEAAFILRDDLGSSNDTWEIVPTYNGFFEWDGGNAIGASDDELIWSLEVSNGGRDGQNFPWVDDSGTFGNTGPNNDPDSNTAQVLFGQGVEDGIAIQLRDGTIANNGSVTGGSGDNKTVQTISVTTDSSFSINSFNNSKLIFDHNSGGTTSLSLRNEAELTINARVDFRDDFVIQQNSNRTLTLDGNLVATNGNADLLRITGSGNTFINGDINENGNNFDIIKNGTGTATFAGSHNVSGSGGDTILNNGTLRLANTDKDNTTLRSSQIDINGGTLLIDNSDQISNSTNIVLSGGTLKLGGVGLTPTDGYLTETLGTLTLSADSTIDFGGNDWRLFFADSSSVTWDEDSILTITNWSGTPTYGDGGDQISFGSNNFGLTSQQLSQIRFADYENVPYYQEYGNLHLVDGEVVPVPEPKFYVGGGALLILIVWFERRRRKQVA